MNYLWLTLLLLFGAHVARADQAGMLQSQAEAAYRQGAYAEAAKYYEQVWRSGQETAGIAYNLALSYYRAGSAGQAAAAVITAYRLNPRDPDLSKLQNAVQFDVGKFISSAHPTWYGWAYALFDVLSTQEIYYSGLMILALGLCLITAAFWLPWRKRWQLFAPGLGLTLLAAILIPVYLSLARSLSEWGAIADDNTAVYSEPEKKEPLVLFTVPVKTPVKEILRVEGWSRVRFADARQGWVPSQELARY